MTGGVDAFAAPLGPFGEPGLRLRSIGVNLSGSRVAPFRQRHRGLPRATPRRRRRGQRPVAGAVDLAPPHWDYRDRMWVLDRGAGRARVKVVVDGGPRAGVPGVSGRTVTELMVSRDGSRLVAVVAVARPTGSCRPGCATTWPAACWGSPRRGHCRSPRRAPPHPRRRLALPDTVSVLRTITEELSLVRTFSVDGSPGGIVISGRQRPW